MSNRTGKNKKLFVLGLDCATPQLVFKQYLDKMPCISGLIENGKHGLLESTHPPVTVPAWMSMFTGKDPGQMGFYGFTDRCNYSYDEDYIVNSNALQNNTVWDYLTERELKSIVIGVPQTYPPKPVDGLLVASFLTPDKSLPFTYPKETASELDLIADGNYVIDIENFRTENKQELLDNIYDMTRKRFKVMRDFIKNKEWDLFVAVEMGIDRLHHGFWRFCVPDHPLYEKGNPFESVLEDYYKFIDTEIARIVELFDDDTALMIVSDHGAKTLKGSFCLNDWLIQNGYLTLKSTPTEIGKLNAKHVDWSKTSAWSKGGYYGKIFFNVEGREPNGVIPKNEIGKFQDELVKNLSVVKNSQGDEIKNGIHCSEEIYSELKNFPPDLIFYCGDLDWRVTDSVGNETLFLPVEELGVDDANHDFNGIFINCENPKAATTKKQEAALDSGELAKYSIFDIAPTVLDFFNIDAEQNLSGKKIKWDLKQQGRSVSIKEKKPVAKADANTEEDDEVIMQRLKDLGYI